MSDCCSSDRARYGRVLVALMLAAPLVACAQPAGTLVIVQNQIPAFDDKTGRCTVTADSTQQSLVYGVFDVDLDQPYPYLAYPVIENRFPSLKDSAGVERNQLSLRRVLVSIKPPAGVDPAWASGCPGDFSSPASGLMDPGSARAVTVQGLLPCHSSHLRDLIAASRIPSGLDQPVYFTLQMTAVADRSGSEQSSAPFPFEVRVCAGCLQPMYPAIPACADAPKPNPLHGNACNIAQDGPAVLCCTNPGGAVICPAPDA